VKLFRTNELGILTGSALGIIKFDDEIESMLNSIISVSTSRTGRIEQSSTTSSPKSNLNAITNLNESYKLNLFLQAEFISPLLRINGKIYDTISKPLKSNVIALDVNVPNLLSNDPNMHKIYKISILISNPLTTTLQFSCVTDGPFMIKDITPSLTMSSVTQKSLSSSKLLSQSNPKKGPVMTSSIGKTLQLLPSVSD
jgi:hypothetical protein